MLLVGINFVDFMTKLRAEMLEKDWDRKIKLSILALKQEERPFHEWAYAIQAHNALLRGRPCHFNDESLRETMQNNMNPGLEIRVRRIAFDAGVLLREWIEAVKEEDEFVVSERVMVKEMAKEMYRAEQRVVKGGGGRTMGTRIDNIPAMRSTVSSSVFTGGKGAWNQ